MRIDRVHTAISLLMISSLHVATPTILSHDHTTCVTRQTTMDDGAGTSCWSTVAFAQLFTSTTDSCCA